MKKIVYFLISLLFFLRVALHSAIDFFDYKIPFENSILDYLDLFLNIIMIVVFFNCIKNQTVRKFFQYSNKIDKTDQ